MNHRALLLCTLLLASVAAFTQGRRGTMVPRTDITGTATVTGTVRSFDGKPIPDVHVEIRQDGNGHPIASAYTLPSGSFEFMNVPRGRYEVVARIGLQETREPLQLQEMNATVEIRMGDMSAASTAGSGTVSVAQMKVPEKARKEFHKAEEAMRKHKIEDSRQHIENALQLAPNYAAALTLRGILDLGENKFDQARSECEQAIGSDPNYGMGYVVLGATYNAMARFDDALRTLERGVALVPQSWQGHFEMSKALLGKAHYEEALRQINRAGELVPASYPAIHLVRAHAFLGLKNYSQAITELEQYLGGAPNGVDAANARETLDEARAFTAAHGSK
jgi:tetratricopeptide (TPR) repeat protein